MVDNRFAMKALTLEDRKHHLARPTGTDAEEFSFMVADPAATGSPVADLGG